MGNPASPYSRALRIGRTLAAQGFVTEIAAVAVAGLPLEERDGELRIRRYAPSGPHAKLAAAFPGVGSGAVPRARPAGRIRLLGRVRRWAAALLRWLLWPHTVRGWWATLSRELAPADLYHACGSLTVAAALRARERDRRAGRRSVVIYDAIDDVFESNNVLGMPAPLRAVHRRREAAWARSADARVTVNDALADRLAETWRAATRPLVIPNYPEPWTAPPERPDLMRRHLRLDSRTRVVLFQGRLGPDLGIDESAEAVLLVPDAVLVLIGFGRWLARCRERDRDPRYVGRHFTLDARHPDDLLRWTASADVALVPLPPISYNQRHATPNKLWEALAVGTPVVVAPDLPVMDDLVTREGLGQVAASLAPEALAEAIREVLDKPADVRDRWRTRIAATARERFSWPVAAGRYAALVQQLMP